MATTYNIKSAVYNMIAARLVWDPDFVIDLVMDEGKRRMYFEESLKEYGYSCSAAELDELERHLKDFINQHGFEQILNSSRSHLNQPGVKVI
jgi:hypothetical protein